jgi:hypothetical protein
VNLLHKPVSQTSSSRKRPSGVAQFTQILDHSSVIQSPYMIWSDSYKDGMIEQVEQHLQPFLSKFSSEKKSYEYRLPKRIVYTDIENQLSIRGVFIEQFVSMSRDQLFELEEPDLLFKDLTVQMKQVYVPHNY